VTFAISDLSVVTWVLLAVAAACAGISKTALPGLSTVSVALFAALLPAKASTGAFLLLLIVGDAFALLSYRRHADWRRLVRLIPAVIAGLALGGVFLAIASDSGVRRLIGVVLLCLIAVTLMQRARKRTAAQTPETAREMPLPARIGYGALGGFTTMVANAGGPVMSMYFLASRLPVKTFLGTAAWFFATINLVKVPISVGLGLITPATLILDLLLVPGVIIGALLGRRVAGRIPQRAFEIAVIICTIAGALYLVIS